MYPSNPEKKKSFTSTRAATHKITPKKLEGLPSIYNPDKSSEHSGPTTPSLSLHIPPSRSISDKSENLHRRAFGKYLKLDDEAMKHL